MDNIMPKKKEDAIPIGLHKVIISDGILTLLDLLIKVKDDLELLETDEKNIYKKPFKRMFNYPKIFKNSTSWIECENCNVLCIFYIAVILTKNSL